MAGSVINVFGKLYTFLRRPRPSEETAENGKEAQKIQSQDSDCMESSVNCVTKQQNAVLVNTDISINKVQDTVVTTCTENALTISTANSESENIQGSNNNLGIADAANDKTKLDKEDVLDKQIGNSGDHAVQGYDRITPLLDDDVRNQDKTGSHETNIADIGSHMNIENTEQIQLETDSINEGGAKKVVVITDKKEKLSEDTYVSYLDFVEAKTQLCQQINAKDLFYKLGYDKNSNTVNVVTAIVGQYKLAVSRNYWSWVKDARYFAELFFPVDWIDKNLPNKNQKSTRKNEPKQRKQKHVSNDQCQQVLGHCQDFRLKDNPSLQRVVTNAVSDNDDSSNMTVDKPESTVTNMGDSAIATTVSKVDINIADYTEQVIQQAMQIAISEGLSESAIMEVIDDVTQGLNKPTPRKCYASLANVDLSQTPRQRTDQLAFGFNYHADVLVQQSPKIVNGKIIPLDTQAPSRARPDQLAVGFSYLAEQLVKNSPRTENGAVVIPGNFVTPRKLARDHLAMGFNYHAEQLVKCSLRTENGEIMVPGNVSTSRKLAKEQLPESISSHTDNLAIDANNHHIRELQTNCHNEMTNGLKEVVKTGLNHQSSIIDIQSSADVYIKSPTKVPYSETYAIGFSGASDLFINGHDKNLPNREVIGIIDGASTGEDKAIEENVDVPVAMALPAGSVW